MSPFFFFQLDIPILLGLTYIIVFGRSHQSSRYVEKRNQYTHWCRRKRRGPLSLMDATPHFLFASATVTFGTVVLCTSSKLLAPRHNVKKFGIITVAALVNDVSGGGSSLLWYGWETSRNKFLVGKLDSQERRSLLSYFQRAFLLLAMLPAVADVRTSINFSCMYLYLVALELGGLVVTNATLAHRDSLRTM